MFPKEQRLVWHMLVFSKQPIFVWHMLSCVEHLALLIDKGWKNCLVGDQVNPVHLAHHYTAETTYNTTKLLSVTLSTPFM